MSALLEIDGSRGEGGGQVLRSSLGLSVLTGRPFRIRKIRAGRKTPGLLRQHLTAVRAAAKISDADMGGARMGSGELEFRPGKVSPGEYEFRVGSAGSATLVLQTVLPPLMVAGGPSRLVLEGGTHNPWAPPFDHLERAFLPLLERFGPKVTARLERPGFYPAGGGRFTVEIEPSCELRPVELMERGEIVARRGRALVANLSGQIARREIREAAARLEWRHSHFEVERRKDSLGPGNVLFLELECRHVTEVFTGFGKKGVKAERVAREAAEELQAYLRANVPVGEHLADQLLIPMAMAGGGRFRTVQPSGHTRTQFAALRDFLEVDCAARELGDGAWEVVVG